MHSNEALWKSIEGQCGAEDRYRRVLLSQEKNKEEMKLMEPGIIALIGIVVINVAAYIIAVKEARKK